MPKYAEILLSHFVSSKVLIKPKISGTTKIPYSVSISPYPLMILELFSVSLNQGASKVCRYADQDNSKKPIGNK